jgi:hypothetical protein
VEPWTRVPWAADPGLDVTPRQLPCDAPLVCARSRGTRRLGLPRLRELPARGMRNGRRKVRSVSNLSCSHPRPIALDGSGVPAVEGSGCRQMDLCVQPFRVVGLSPRVPVSSLLHLLLYLFILSSGYHLIF